MAGVAGTVESGQREHGQALALAAVVKVHVTAAIWLPAASLAPLSVTVYVVDVESAAVGVSDAVLVGPSYAVVAATEVAPAGEAS